MDSIVKRSIARRKNNDDDDCEQTMQHMRFENPKRALKVWMLPDACTAVQTKNDDAKCHKSIDLMKCSHE